MNLNFGNRITIEYIIVTSMIIAMAFKVVYFVVQGKRDIKIGVMTTLTKLKKITEGLQLSEILSK